MLTTTADRPLRPGIYNVRSPDETPLAADALDGVVQLELRPYVRCTDLGDLGCDGGPPADEAELGVPDAPARVVDLELSDALHVEVHGFACDADELSLDRQAGTGADLLALFTEFDSSYATAIAGPASDGVDPEQLIAELGAQPVAGFHDPGCPAWTRVTWTPSSGPTMISSAPFATSAATAAGALPTALRVDDGAGTLHVYAGFLS
jgi:hypothetical protein